MLDEKDRISDSVHRGTLKKVCSWRPWILYTCTWWWSTIKDKDGQFMKESWQFEGDSSKVGSHVIRLSNEDDDIYRFYLIVFFCPLLQCFDFEVLERIQLYEWITW